MRDQHSSTTGSFPTGGYPTGGYSTGSYMRPGGRPLRKGSSRGKGFLFLMVAILFAVVAGYLVMGALEKAASAQKPIPTVPVVVASRDISLGTTLTREHFKIVQWPEEHAPSSRFARIEDLEGRVAKVDIFEGEMIHDARLAPIEAGKGLNALIPSGMRAQAIRVNDESGVAGFIHPGDFVDIVMIFRVQNEKLMTEMESRTAIQNVKVLAIGDQYQTSDESRGKAIKVPVVTVLVTPQQAEQLALAITNGKIVLTLRNGYDSEEVVSTGFSPNRLREDELAAAVPPPGKPEKEEGKREGKRIEKEPVEEPPPAEPPPPTVQVIRGDKIIRKN